MKNYKLTEKSKKKYLHSLTDESLEDLFFHIENNTNYSNLEYPEDEDFLSVLLDVPPRYIFEAEEHWEDEDKDWEEWGIMINTPIEKLTKTDFGEDFPQIKEKDSVEKILKKLQTESKQSIRDLAQEWNQAGSNPKVKEWGFKKEILNSFKKVKRDDLIEFLFTSHPSYFDSPTDLEDCKTDKQLFSYASCMMDKDVKRTINRLKKLRIKFPRKKSDDEWSDILMHAYGKVTFDELVELIDEPGE
jgi:hypothetical protein